MHSIVVGGIAPVVTELAAAQQRAGHEVHVFTRLAAGQKEYEVIDGVHYHRCAFNWHPNLVEEMKNMSEAMVHCLFKHEDEFGAFDIVHGHDWHVVHALDKIKNERGRHIVFTVHSTEYGRMGNSYNGNGAINGMEWYGTYIAERVTVCTNAMKNEVMHLHRVPEDKIRVVPNGIHAWKFDGEIDPWNDCKKKYGFGPWDPMVLFVGRMEWQKGPDMLLEAVPLVLRERPDAKFVFVGKGSMLPGLRARAWQLGVNHAVVFTGYVSEEEKIRLLKSADVLVVPSRNEPFGMVVLEAWSCKKPVIATHGTGAGELVWHEVTGLKVFQNPESIAWGIKRIFSDFDHARWMGENGRYAAEKAFNWDNVASKMLSVYQELVG